MYTGYYSNKLEKETNKYDGLLTKKQKADLEGETEILVVKKVSKDYITQRRRETMGASNALTDPLNKGTTGETWRR